jgi:magnesium-transporting ATPase (P-type)
MGTVVHQGAGRGVVVATGSSTAFGKIAVGLSERQAETAFQAGLRGFSKLLVAVAAVLTTSIFVITGSAGLRSADHGLRPAFEGRPELPRPRPGGRLAGGR